MSIKQGHQFKGSPLCFAHLAPQRMLATFMRTASSAEIIDAQVLPETDSALDKVKLSTLISKPFSLCA